MPALDKTLAKELAAARRAPRNFLVCPGKEGSALMLSKKPIPAARAKEARQQSGGTKIYRGRCFLEGATLVFESADSPPGDLAKKIRMAASEQAGMTIKVEVRAVAEVAEIDAGDEEDQAPEAAAAPPPSAPPPSEPPSPSSAEAQFKERAKQTKALLDQLKAVDSGRAQPLVTQFATALGHAQAKRFEPALTILEAVDGQVRDAVGGGAAAAPTAPRTPPPPPPDAAAAFAARLKALLPGIKQAQAAGGPVAEEVKLRAGEAQVFARKADFAQANAILDRIEERLGAPGRAEPATPPPAPPPQQEDGYRDEFERRMAAIRPWIDDLVQTGPEAKAALEPLEARAREAAKRGDSAAALELVEKIERQLDRLTGMGSGTDEEDEPTPGAGPPPPTDAPPPLPGAAERFKEQAKVTKGLLDQLKAAGAAEAAALTTEFATALGHAQAKRFEQALGIVERVADEARDALKAAEAPADDPAAAYQQRVASLTPRLKDALKAGGATAIELKLKFSESQTFGRKQAFDRANALLDEVEELLGPEDEGPRLEWESAMADLEPDYLQALRDHPDKAGTLRGVWAFAQQKGEAGEYPRAMEALRGSGELEPGDGAAPSDGLAAWMAARDRVVGDLRQAVAAVTATNDPYADAAIIELQSIIKNLTSNPQTPQAVAELQRYLSTDSVITDAEAIPSWVATLRIRQPLLNALKALKL